MQTGSLFGALQSGIWGAVSAGVAYGVGHSALFTNLYTNAGSLGDFYRALAHGISRSIITIAQGGKAVAGFLSGFSSSLIGGAVKYIKASRSMATTVLKTVITAIGGGTASLLGGGKFANGAFSGAFVYLFNHAIELIAKNAEDFFNKTTGIYSTIKATKYGEKLLKIAIADLSRFKLRLEYYKELGYVDRINRMVYAISSRQAMWNNFFLQYVIQGKINYKLIKESNEKLKDYY